MKKYKKLFAILLALSLLLLVGCGEDQDLDAQMQLDQEEDMWSDDEETIFDGWWVRPWDYESEGISLVDCFLLDGVAGTFTVYSPYGDELETFECYVDGDMVTLDLGVTQADFIYDQGSLLDPDTGEEEYIGVIDPDFLTASAGGDTLDGTWYRLGDLSGSQIYELYGTDYKKIIEEDVVSEGSFLASDVTVFIGEYTPGQVLTLDLGDGQPSLVPTTDGTMLLEEDGFDVYLYASQEASEATGFEAFSSMEALLNTTMLADVFEGGGYCLNFYPSCFQIMDYTVDGRGEMFRGETVLAGQWALEGNQIRLMMDDGSEEWIDLPDEDFSFYLPTLDCWFYPQ